MDSISWPTALVVSVAVAAVGCDIAHVPVPAVVSVVLTIVAGALPALLQPASPAKDLPK